MPKSQPSAQKSASTKSETTIWTGVAWGVFLGSTAVFVIGWFAIRLSPTTVNTGNNSIGVATLLTSLIVLSAFIYLLLPIVRSHQDRSPPHPDRTNSSPEDRKYDLVQIGLTVFGAFGAIFLVATGYMALNVGSKVTGLGTGAFGDAFGAATSIFTALAFLGLLLASQIQRKELKTAQESFKQLQKQTEQVLTTQRTQILEDRFFKLIEQIDNRRRETPKPFLLAEKVAEDLIEIADGLVLDGLKRNELIDEFQKRLVHHRTNIQRSSNVDYLRSLGILEIAAADSTLLEGNLKQFETLLATHLTHPITVILMYYTLCGKAGYKFSSDGERLVRYKLNSDLPSEIRKAAWNSLADFAEAAGNTTKLPRF